MESLKDLYFRLLKATQKTSSTSRLCLVDQYYCRPAAVLALLLIRDRRFSPNWITGLSILTAAIGGLFLARLDSYSQIIGAVIFFNISLVLDALDGQYARHTKLFSEFGKWFDIFSDVFKYIFMFFPLTVGLSHLYPDRERPILWMGMWAMTNVLLAYTVLLSKQQFNMSPGNIAKMGQRYYVGMEAFLYCLFTALLILNQPYALLVILCPICPALWIVQVSSIVRANFKRLDSAT